MRIFRAQAYVTLKEGVLDPQGQTVQGALRSLGYAEVDEVRIGKFIEIKLEAQDETSARRAVEEMCERLLANPVLERYRVEIEEDGA